MFSQVGHFTAFRLFDVPDLLARDLSKLSAFASAWYGHQSQKEFNKDLPTKIILPSDLLPIEETPQKKLVLEAAQDLASYLRIGITSLSVSAHWDEIPPKEAENQGLHAFLDKVGKDTFLYANHHSAAGFRDEYKTMYHKTPFVNPFVRWRWSIGSTGTSEDYKEAVRRMDVYKQWFLEEIFQVGKVNTFVVMQSEDVVPKYRDDPPP